MTRREHEYTVWHYETVCQINGVQPDPLWYARMKVANLLVQPIYKALNEHVAQHRCSNDNRCATYCEDHAQMYQMLPHEAAT